MRKNNKGITLIALVITIIILIILAAISISMLLGDEGIIERAKRASQNYTIAADEEHSLLDYLTGTLEDNDVVEEARGNGTLSGEGTESSPYLIQSIEDLVYLSNQVKGGDTYTGKYFKLEVSLDFKDRKSYLNPDSRDFGDINENGPITTLYEELTTGKGFYPIGVSDYRFEGIFDGNNKSIRNMQGRSLFGYINNSTIKNLKMLNVNISYSQGGIIDTASGDVIIDNCKTTGELTYNDYGYNGGIIGYVTSYSGNSSNSLKIYFTSNGINITHNAYDKGGIVGTLGVNAEFKNCTNTGKITGSGEVGGILGFANSSSSRVDFTNCTNTGIITGNSSSGGILGNMYKDAYFTNCHNTGNVIGSSSNLGGIAGHVDGISSFTDCSNIGDVTGRSYMGGIVGYIARSDITNCSNTGDITGTESTSNYIGGMAGYISSTVNYTNCSNAGDITGNYYTGGISGRAVTGTISHCYNTGTINGIGSNIGDIGGIAGGVGSSAPNITHCYNTGTISINVTNAGINNIGAIVGYMNNATQQKVTYCYNTGDIIIQTTSGINRIGGICGSNGIVENSYNTGNITTKTSGTASQIGGIIGAANKNVTNCYNTGTLTITSNKSDPEIGGIVGSNGTIENCYNIGNVETNASNNRYIGSIIGSYSTLTGCYYLAGTHENATGYTSYECDVTAVEDEDTMKSIINTKLATIEGWKISTTGGYPELEF